MAYSLHTVTLKNISLLLFRVLLQGNLIFSHRVDKSEPYQRPNMTSYPSIFALSSEGNDTPNFQESFRKNERIRSDFCVTAIFPTRSINWSYTQISLFQRRKVLVWIPSILCFPRITEVGLFPTGASISHPTRHEPFKQPSNNACTLMLTVSIFIDNITVIY